MSVSSTTGAAFLSYAREDAAAARRIAEALRARGIEVWFDEDELRGGDAWDQSIRKQIKECALFVPIISANTQARREGYFRIEWKLAAQRTHAIAEGTPFLLPIMLDGVQEGQALVPSEFREVQWTALSADNAIVAFSARVRHLTGDSPAEAAPRSADANPPETRAGRRTSRRRLVLGAFVIVALVIAFGFVGWRRRLHQPAAATANLAKATLRTAELAQRSSIETRDVLDAVVEHARRETEASSESAAAWSKRARLEAQYVVRRWDVSDQRRQDVQTHANRALALDPASVDAMFALAVVFLHQGAYAEAETLMRKATAREPSDAELRQALGTALSGEGRDAEALALRKENLRLFPNNPFAYYDLALSFEKATPPDLDAALRKFDDSIALQPFTSTVLHKVSLLAGWKGDLSGAQRLLDNLDPLERTGDRAVGIAMMLGLLQHQPDRVSKAAGLTASTYFDDDYVRGPKAWLLAHAHTQAGKPSLALAQWREAESILRQRLRASAENWFDQAGLAITLAWLGEQPEAASIIAPVEAVAHETAKPLQLLYLAYYYAGCGDAAKTASYLRPVLERREMVTAKTLPLDPWWDKVRAAPPFVALLSNPEDAGAVSALPAPDPKSIAVLPFANLSTEKENEFFADGVQDDVITNLAKIRDLTVISRTSTLAYRDPAARSLKKIGADLGVATILEGSVRRVGTKVHMNAQLIDARTDRHLWAQTFDGDASDPFALQADVAQKIAAALKATLTPGERSLLARRPTTSQEAYDLYTRAQLLGQALNPAAVRADYEVILSLDEQAVAKDPSFALAFAHLSEIHGLMYWFVDRTPERRARAEVALAAARKLAPDAPEIHFAQGEFAYRCNQDYKGALAEFALAEQGMPKVAGLQFGIGNACRRLGQFAEATTRYARAIALNPKALNACVALVQTLSAMRRYSEMRAIADRYLAIFPDDWILGSLRTQAQFALDGDYSAYVRAHADRGIASNDPSELQFAYRSAMFAGNLAEAQRILADARFADPGSSGWLFFAGVGPAAAAPFDVLQQRGLVAFLLGKQEAAARVADEALELFAHRAPAQRTQGDGVPMAIAQLEAFAGRADAALRDGRAQLKQSHATDAFSALFAELQFATIQLILDRWDDALVSLRRTMSLPGAIPAAVRHDLVWSRLKDDPRFEEILRSAKTF